MKSRATLVLSILLLTASLKAQEKIHYCINEKGEKLFSIKAKWVSSFSEGMADVQRTVLENGKPFYRYGFIDEKGNDVIDCIYEKVYAFSHGVAWVRLPGKDEYFLINKSGTRVSDGSWKRVGYFYDGMCAVYDTEGKIGFVNRQGKQIVPCKYTGDGFSEGLACVMPFEGVTPNYGFIDTTGNVVIPFQFNQAGTSSFDNGECRVQIKGVTCLINKKGEVVFKPTLTKNTQGFYNGLSASYTNYNTRSGWGYYNRNNAWVIKPQYDNATSFSKGYAVVEKGGKQGVIDTMGKFTIPMKYASVFGDATEDYFGLELVANGDKQYVRPNGKPFAQVPIKYLFPRYNGSLHPYTNADGKYGYLNMDGSVFMNAQFENAGSFYEGKAWIRGNTDALKTAEGAGNFVRDYTVGEKVKARKNGSGSYYPGTIRQVGEYYYLILFDDGTQEWVTFGSIKR